MSHVDPSITLKALTALRRSDLHRPSICNNYARFSELKQRWIESNPEATTTEYDATMRRFARECGI